MGEWNEPFGDKQVEDTHAGILEHLAKYLYENYEANPEPTGIGGSQPWNTAEKRKREWWFIQAQELLDHLSQLLLFGRVAPPEKDPNA